MASVEAVAITGGGVVGRSAAPPGAPDPAAASAVRPVAGFAVAATVCLLLALRLPAATAVVGLATFGILHNVLELRYLAGRFEGLLHGPFLRLLTVLISGIVACRLLPSSYGTRAAEILLAYALLAAACLYALGSRPTALACALAVVVTAAAASLAYPDEHFVVLTHLHNVVPLFFLWEWSRGMRRRGRIAFRAVQVGWIAVIPALLLSGALDGWSAGTPGSSSPSGWIARLSRSYAPAAWQHSGMALRLVTVFAFMALMHYLVWVWFMPRHAPDATAAFERRVPGLTGRWAWGLGLGGGAALAVLFATDYTRGTSLYAAVASYHAYLEFPVLLALVLRLRPRSPEGTV